MLKLSYLLLLKVIDLIGSVKVNITSLSGSFRISTRATPFLEDDKLLEILQFWITFLGKITFSFCSFKGICIILSLCGWNLCLKRIFCNEG